MTATSTAAGAATAMTDDAVARAGAVRFAAAVFTSRRLWHLAAPQGLGRTRHGRILLVTSCLIDGYEMWRSRRRPLPYPVRPALRIGDLLLWSWRSADDEESQQVAGVAATPLAFESGFRSPGAVAAACSAAAAAILAGHRLARRPAQPEQIFWYGLMAAPGLGMRAVERVVSASIVKTDQAYTAARYREAWQQDRRSVLIGAQNPPIEDIQQAARVLWYAAAAAPQRPDSINITGVLQELKTALRDRARVEFTGSGPDLATTRATTLTTPDAARELRLRLFTPVLANWVDVQPAPGQEETTLSSAAVDHLTWYLGQRPWTSSVRLRVLARNSLEVSEARHHEVVTVPDNDAEFLPLRHLDAAVIAVAAAALLLLVPDRPRGGPRETLRRQGGPALVLLALTAVAMHRGLAGHRVAPDAVLGASTATSLTAVHRTAVGHPRAPRRWHPRPARRRLHRTPDGRLLEPSDAGPPAALVAGGSDAGQSDRGAKPAPRGRTRRPHMAGGGSRTRQRIRSRRRRCRRDLQPGAAQRGPRATRTVTA